MRVFERELKRQLVKAARQFPAIILSGELHALAKRERNSWIGRYFYRLKPVV